MRLTRTIASVAAVAVALLAPGLPPAAGDTALVSYTCDLPAGATGSLASQIPDTITEEFEITVEDSPDPVIQGQNLHLDLDVPFPDFTGGLPELPIAIDLPYIYVRQVDIWQPLPAGINFASVQASLTPSPNWATVTREGGNLRIRVQSAVPNSYIRIDADAEPPTIEVETSPGVWAPIDVIPSVDVDATVNGPRGGSIQWRPPTLNAVVKFNINIPFVIVINWNDVNTPCIPDNPTQAIVSTLIASPTLAATLSRTPATVTPGQTITYTAALQNTGDVPLTGLTVAIPDATCDPPPASLAVGATADVACTHTATVADLGTYTRSATVNSAQTTATTTNAVSTTVSPRRIADAAVGTAAAGPFTGGDVYGATVTPAQTAKANVARGRNRTFHVQVGNDGDATDSFRVRGQSSGATGFNVKYFDAGGTNITAAVRAGTYVVPNLAPGASVTLRVKVKATPTSRRGAGHKADVRVSSVASPSASDVVRAKVKRT